MLHPSRGSGVVGVNPGCELARGLVGAWVTFPEVAGGPTLWDVSGRDHHAALVNPPITTLEGPDGLATVQATHAAGVAGSPYYDCGTSPLLNVTAGGWVAAGFVFGSGVANAEGALIARDAGAGNQSFALHVKATSLGFDVNGSGKLINTTFTPSVRGQSRWSRIFAAGGPAWGWRFYLDGVLINNAIWSTPPNASAGPTTLLRRQAAGNEDIWFGLGGGFLMSSFAPPSNTHAAHLAALDYDEWVRGWPNLFRRRRAWSFPAPAAPAGGAFSTAFSAAFDRVPPRAAGGSWWWTRYGEAVAWGSC